jgi:4-hydroxy 2-oxovalerate aldolase
MLETIPATRSLGRAKRVDVTLRDGAFATGFSWSIDEAVGVVRTADRVGCEYVEVGYLGGPPDAHGVSFDRTTGCVDQRLIECLAEHAGRTRLVAMLHPTVAVMPSALRSASEAGLGGVRLVYHPSWSRVLSEYAAQLRDLGLWVSVNLALASHYSEREFEATTADCAALQPDALYLADTSAGLLPSELPPMLNQMAALHSSVGVHMHNHLGLALANSIVGVDHGATLVDYSTGGVGRGAGNLQAEAWEALLAAETGDWGPVVAQVELKDRIRNHRDGLMQALNWVQFVSGALNLKPPEEDALAAACRGTEGSEPAQLDAVLEFLRGSTGLKRRCAL